MEFEMTMDEIWDELLDAPDPLFDDFEDDPVGEVL